MSFHTNWWLVYVGLGPILGPFDVWQTYGLGLSQFAGLVGRSVWTIIANHWLVVSDSGRLV